MQAVYIGPEEVIVAAKVRPSPRLTAEDLAQAMDDLDRRASQSVAVRRRCLHRRDEAPRPTEAMTAPSCFLNGAEAAPPPQ